ncbi:uncharacterized protein LOC116339323 [Contarinia nasturtii]|uniref:uncharacterized protein LOC116339323 n=1 Tax=Contarinia nasturtii TaxID=265458 RepID=UPI0012D4C1C7|nr:uncharacterized protein LOC116339323 [Contarinia nasturtii]XP_031621015.1 uncharacterized protein LOC116339323 [Contarinia nasturtii]XP_031621021.1 uncharacterized protein LOC116339323 [Contarinia nasturtii]
MGIRYLLAFTSTNFINMRDEVIEWKRAHRGNKPIIAIDFKNLVYAISTSEESDICGGRHKETLKLWEDLLEALKKLDCKFIFFADSITPMWKVGEWMQRRDEDFDKYKKLYELIKKGTSLEVIPGKIYNLKSLIATYYEMLQKAREYGDFPYSACNDNDSEIAYYAKENEVFAVISNDSDFLIYDGPWKLWSIKDFNNAIRLEATEYNRDSLLEKLQLPRHKMPLWATLVGNDYTKKDENLKRFHVQLSRKYNHGVGDRQLFGSIVKYMNTLNFGPKALDFNITQVARSVFGSDHRRYVELIKNSVDSYNIDNPLDVNMINDPIGKKIYQSKNPIYQSYKALIYPIVGISLPYYDMRGRRPGGIFTDLIVQYTNRKKGILLMETRPETYTLLAKKEANQHFERSEEKIIYPDFTIPPLHQLYLGNTSVVDSEIIGTRWKIFQFIMMFSEEDVKKVKALDKQFRLIGTVLYVLVKKRLLSVEEADGILYTEHRVYDGTDNNRKPVKVVDEHIRSAHIYVKAFDCVRENFAVAGLLSQIQEKLLFNGVFFQQIIHNMSDAFRHKYMNSLQKYRIYA